MYKNRRLLRVQTVPHSPMKTKIYEPEITKTNVYFQLKFQRLF